uniref:Uncharacterized protein n=1 Tax=Anguilla anguilla TaxID=7936 RepID=A0A0E9XTE6_ANGAN
MISTTALISELRNFLIFTQEFFDSFILQFVSMSEQYHGVFGCFSTKSLLNDFQYLLVFWCKSACLEHHKEHVGSRRGQGDALHNLIYDHIISQLIVKQAWSVNHRHISSIHSPSGFPTSCCHRGRGGL